MASYLDENSNVNYLIMPYSQSKKSPYSLLGVTGGGEVVFNSSGRFVYTSCWSLIPVIDQYSERDQLQGLLMLCKKNLDRKLYIECIDLKNTSFKAAYFIPYLFSILEIGTPKYLYNQGMFFL